jgi:choline-sulfatase
MSAWRPISGDCLRAFWLALAVAAWGAVAFAAPAVHPTPVILISVDTLRADHLGCYGYRQIRTPAIDSLTAGGSRFVNAISQIPLTLPSHASLFTSTYPFSNGVEDNGEVLQSGSSTLASVLKTHGYATAAFIGGFALDARFGLNQGFDVYDSPFALNQDAGIDATALKRPGEEVARAAERWIDHNSGSPFFLFLHLYDLHTPYQEHGDLGISENTSGYDEELVYTDRVLGQFFGFLREKGLYDKALIVFVADHG